MTNNPDSQAVISVFPGPVTNTTRQKLYSWPKLFTLLTGPPEVLADNQQATKAAAKLGYYVRGIIDGNRDDDHLGACSLVVLDVDKPAGKKPLPKPLEVHRALKGIRHVVHATATPGRCRIVFPVEPYPQTEAERLTKAAYQYCMNCGLHFALSGESKTKSQPFFLPQTTDPNKHEAYGCQEGTKFRLDFAGDISPLQEPPKQNTGDQDGQGQGAHNPLEEFIAELQSGTIHEAAKHYAGWLHRTSNHTTQQIFDQITTLIYHQCADPGKVQRWESGERESFAKWFATNAGGGGEWEPEVKEWPVLDAKAYHGIAGDFVKLATRSSEADPAAVLGTFLPRVAVEFGPAPTLYVGDTKHKARLAAVIVGASAKARKGTSGKPVSRVFELIEGQARHSPGPFSSGEGIIYAVRDAVKKWDEKKQCEVIVDPGVADKRFFILDEEFAGFLAHTKREGNTLSTVVRCAWDTGMLDPLTKTTKTTATNAHVGWVSHITASELSSRLDSVEAFNGFANRILWICAKRSKIVSWPEPMPDDELDAIRHRLTAAIAQVPKRGYYLMTWSSEAKAAWCGEHYAKLTEDQAGLVGCVVNRAEAQVIRLAMVYALLDGNNIIGLDHLEAALAFWRYCEASARYIFHGRQADQTAQRILDALAAGPISGKQLHELFSNNIRKERLEAALSELKASDRIESETLKTGGKGRPTTLWKIKTLNELNEQNEINTDKGQGIKSFNSFSSLGKLKNQAENEVRL